MPYTKNKVFFTFCIVYEIGSIRYYGQRMTLNANVKNNSSHNNKIQCTRWIKADSSSSLLLLYMYILLIYA
jgi:hypothetical protein